jgi:hypothetical protein
MRLIHFVKIFVSIVLLAAYACSTKPKTTESTAVVTKPAVVNPPRSDKSKYYTKMDSINIEGVMISKDEFNAIIDSFPSLYRENPTDPMSEYHGTTDSQYMLEPDADKSFMGFDSEVGKDFYVFLYTYFLKQKNGVEKYAIQRKRLIDICLKINDIFDILSGGGTFYSHMQGRLYGDVEYAVYQFSLATMDTTSSAVYTVNKAKFIESLRKSIEDGYAIDPYQKKEDQLEVKRKANRIVDSISRLINNNFYLIQARQFREKNYDWE